MYNRFLDNFKIDFGILLINAIRFIRFLLFAFKILIYLAEVLKNNYFMALIL